MFYNAFNKKIMKQVTNNILMIRPVNFRYNKQTAVNNYYQKVLNDVSNDLVQKQALLEFNNFVRQLQKNKSLLVEYQETCFPPYL